jgi:hypothetical protein
VNPNSPAALDVSMNRPAKRILCCLAQKTSRLGFLELHHLKLRCDDTRPQ